ncbi:MAG: hypothetical protein K9N01_12210 [Cephaloticoccus sp.]|nr:hypothetical protein [Cephaloticoccus sp.]
MNPHELESLHIIHVLSAIGLIATTFYACSGAPETRKKVVMWAGIASLLVVLTGIRMWQGLYGFAGGWAIVKLVCWLGLSAFAGIAYRRRARAALWIQLTLVLTLVSLTMVYLRPF